MSEQPDAVKDVERWVEAYQRAWASNEPDDIRALFTEDATYLTAPDREPWVGQDRIVHGWIDRKDEPGDYKFRHKIFLASEDGPSLVRGWTDYSDGKRYSNLWVIRLGTDGRATEFTEWWMEID